MRVNIADNSQIEKMMRNNFFIYLHRQLLKQKHSCHTIDSVLSLIDSQYEKLTLVFSPLQLLKVVKAKLYPKENIEALINNYSDLLSLGVASDTIINMIANTNSPAHLLIAIANAYINSPANCLLREVEWQINVTAKSKKRSRVVSHDQNEEPDADFVPLRKKFLDYGILPHSIFFTPHAQDTKQQSTVRKGYEY